MFKAYFEVTSVLTRCTTHMFCLFCSSEQVLRISRSASKIYLRDVEKCGVPTNRKIRVRLNILKIDRFACSWRTNTIMVSDSAKILALVVTAIKNLRELKGSTSREILHYLSSVYDISPNVARRQVSNSSYHAYSRVFSHVHRAYRSNADADRVKARRRLRYPEEERGLLHSTDEQRDKLPRNCRTGGQSTGRLSQK